jgi:sugar phosphate isomerase/epimerase
MHERLSVHQICFANLALPDYVQQCQTLGAQRLGFISPALLADGGAAAAKAALTGSGLQLQTVAHVFRAGPLSNDFGEWQASRDTLNRLIDITAELGGRSIYMLTGGHGDLAWEQAAAIFCEAIAPCVDHARQCGISLAIENAGSAYADLHIVHSLADTLRLAEMADIGVCIELFFCWTEAQLPTLFKRALPRCQLVQLSDYVYGDRALPARAVPGDGAIPLERIVKLLLDAGYDGSFDLELLGPRIEAEGAPVAVARAAAYCSALLDRLNA